MRLENDLCSYDNIRKVCNHNIDPDSPNKPPSASRAICDLNSTVCEYKDTLGWSWLWGKNMDDQGRIWNEEDFNNRHPIPCDGHPVVCPGEQTNPISGDGWWAEFDKNLILRWHSNRCQPAIETGWYDVRHEPSPGAKEKCNMDLCTGTATAVPSTCGDGNDANDIPCAVDDKGGFLDGHVERGGADYCRGQPPGFDGDTGDCVFVAGYTPNCFFGRVSAVDEDSNTVTLEKADNSIAAGHLLRLVDARGKTCAAEPKGTDLTVDAVSRRCLAAEQCKSLITFSTETEITTGDEEAATNCLLIRAETAAQQVEDCEPASRTASQADHDICDGLTLSGTDYSGVAGTDRRNSCEDPGSGGNAICQYTTNLCPPGCSEFRGVEG